MEPDMVQTTTLKAETEDGGSISKRTDGTEWPTLRTIPLMDLMTNPIIRMETSRFRMMISIVGTLILLMSTWW